MSGEKIAVVPGSFDPVTLGHMDIVRRAAILYDKVYMAVMINPDKKYMFSISQRRKIAEAACRGYANVEVISSDGMLWQLAQSLGACAIVKGVRNETDRKYELEMAKFNAGYYPAGKTVLLDTAPGLENVSSTVVRERLRNGMSIEGLVPAAAADAIYKIIPRQI